MSAGVPMKSFHARSIWFLLRISLLWTWLGTSPALAVTVPDLYELSMPVSASRDAAFVDALKLVVVRVSGSRDAAARLGPELKNPRQYVQRFGFTADNVLQVGFDSVSIDRMLTEAGLPVWGRERPATLVLLRITAADGSSRWIEAAGASAEREAITHAAKQRGLPLIWPELTTQDRMQMDAASDLSGSDRPALQQIAARYNANATLLGNARSEAGGFSVHWFLTSDAEAANATGSLEEGVHLAADTFARVYSASGTSLDSIAVEVAGINTLGAYANTLNYLEGMTLVRGVAVEQVLGDTMKFRLAVRGDINTLRRALALEGKLIPLAATGLTQDTPQASAPQPDSASTVTPSPGERLQFRYQP